MAVPVTACVSANVAFGSEVRRRCSQTGQRQPLILVIVTSASFVRTEHGGPLTNIRTYPAVLQGMFMLVACGHHKCPSVQPRQAHVQFP